MKALFFSILFLSSAPLLASELPEDLHCVGTEPFWGTRLSNSGPNVFTMMDEQTPLEITKVDNYSGMSHGAGFYVRTRTLDKDKKVLNLYVLEANGCSDGMSENEYEKYAVLDFNQETVYYGCCNVIKSEGVLYSVHKVAVGDGLNVPEGPGTSHPVVGKLPHDATGIQQSTCVNNWCFVTYKPKSGEAINGYVNKNFLKSTPKK